MSGANDKSGAFPAGARLRVECCDVDSEGGFSAACERLVRRGLAIGRVRAVRWRACRVAVYVEDPTGDIMLDDKSPFTGNRGGFEELKLLSVDSRGQVVMLVGGDASAYLSTTARTADLNRGLAALVPVAERGKSFEFGIGELPAARISTCVNGSPNHLAGRRPLGLVGKRKVWVFVDRQGVVSALPVAALTSDIRALAAGSPFDRIGTIPIPASSSDPRWFEKIVWTVDQIGGDLKIHAAFPVGTSTHEAWILTDGKDVLERFPVPETSPSKPPARPGTRALAAAPSRSSSRRP